MTKMAAMVIHGKTFTRNRMAIISLKPSMESKMISNDQELIQLDPTSCPQNQKGNN